MKDSLPPKQITAFQSVAQTGMSKAAKSAQNYLDIMSFSRQELIDPIDL